MRKIRNLISLVCLAMLAACAEKIPNYAEHWRTWGDQQLSRWLASVIELDHKTADFCDDENGMSADSLEILRTAFEKTNLIWAESNGMPYHAIADFSLIFELHFWPDRRDMTAARIRNRLASDQPLTPDTLVTATAAEKGLLALEYLTFEQEMDNSERCQLLPTVSQHYLANVEKVYDYHQNNPLVQQAWIDDHGSREGQSISLNLLFQQFAQLASRLGNSINSEGELIPILAEGWRAGMSEQIYLISLQTEILHLEVLYERADLTVNTLGLLEAQIQELQEIASTMTNGVFDWLTLQQSIADAQALIEGPVAQDLDILIGFNNFDGD